MLFQTSPVAAKDRSSRKNRSHHDIFVSRVSLVDHPVREGLPHGHPGDLADAVAHALEVLDVDGGEDVDARGEHVLDILVALVVLEPGLIGVGELVDEADLGPAAQDPRQVHLLDHHAAVGHPPARDGLEAGRLGGRLGPAMGLDEADDHVAPLALALAALLEHAKGLSDSGGHPQEDLVMSAWQPSGALDLRLSRSGAGRSSVLIRPGRRRAGDLKATLAGPDGKAPVAVPAGACDGGPAGASSAPGSGLIASRISAAFRNESGTILPV